jgi:hypothetical protein
MKKMTIVALMAAVAMFAVSCKNQPKEAEPVEEPAAEEVTECCSECDSTCTECTCDSTAVVAE